MAIGFLFLSETHLKYWVFTIPISLNQFPGAYYKDIDLILRCKMIGVITMCLFTSLLYC